MDQTIEAFVNSKRVAVVGVSRSGKKFGNSACKELRQRGYEVYVVHPEAKEIDGQPCYPNLATIADKVDAVLVCVPAEQGAAVLREAAALGLRRVWLQQGAESPELLALAQDLGLDVVAKKCVLMYAPPVGSIHGWHRAWVKFTGKL
jgi:hypothetical protein